MTFPTKTHPHDFQKSLTGILLFAGTVACAATYTLGASSIFVGPAAGSNSVVLAVSPATAAWTASTNAPWLHLADTYQSGFGSGNVIFSYDANLGGTRSGTLTIADQPLPVTQAGSTYLSLQTMNSLVHSGISQPRGLAVDAAGNVFIADTGNSAIKVWTPTNRSITTLVSSGLSSPLGVAVDGSGNVYVADTGNGAIKEWVASSQTVIPLVSTGLFSPSAVGVDGVGNVYIADGHDEVIFEWMATNSALTNLSIPNPTSICSPPSLTVDLAGNVYFDDTCEDGLHKWTVSSGTDSTLQCCWLYNPTGMGVDGQGNVFIADQADNWIWQWSPVSNNGTMTVPISGLNRPGGVAADNVGNLYVADTGNNAIEEWSTVYLDPTPKVEGVGAGSDFLPAVVPASATQLASFAPSSDQPWLTITGVTNGVVYFTFAAATSTRTATISLFGQRFPITQRAASVALGTSVVWEGPVAGSDSVVLAVYPNSNVWMATANVNWLHLSQSGAGSTNIVFGFDANPELTRTGTLSIAGLTLTVTQAGSTYVPTQPVVTLVSGKIGMEGDAVDGAGNVFFTLYYQGAIQEWSVTNNTVSTIPSRALNNPSGVATDGAGNVYFNGNGIEKWNAADGSVTPVAAVSSPQPVVDSQGNIYLNTGGTVYLWAAANNTVFPVVTGLNGASGLAMDVAGNFYFHDTTGIREWNAANQSLTTLAVPNLSASQCMAVDGEGNIYLVGQNSYLDHFYVYKWTAANNTLTPIFSSGMAEYFGIAVNGFGDI